MRLAQGKIIEWKQSGVEGKGMFSVSVHIGCIKEELPESLKANVYIQLDRDGDFLLTQRDVDLIQSFRQFELSGTAKKCD
ncbi:MAG: hypothetical protein ACI93R_001975 [Flavobacteriales bacterium]|jgi:hypothetical protein